MQSGQSMYSPRQTGGLMTAGGLGALGTGLYGLFGSKGPNPYDQAQPYLNQIPGQLHSAYDPYIQSGQQAQGQLQSQYGSLINDPTALMNHIGAGYQQSPGYQWQLGQGLNSATNAAAAGGLAGSPQHQQQAQMVGQGLANQDYYNYLNHGLEQYGMGIQGLQGQQQLGYGASSGLAGGLNDYYNNQGALAYANQSDQNQAKQQSWGDIFGGLGSILGGGFLR